MRQVCNVIGEIDEQRKICSVENINVIRPSSKIDVSFKAGNRCLADETYLELNRDVAFQFNRIARIKYDLNKVQNLIPFQN